VIKQSSPDRPSSGRLSILTALIVGWLLVNIPALIIMLGILFIGGLWEPKAWWIFLSIGFILGWTWWSHTIPRWRRWAHRHGVPPERLQKFAVLVGLTWRKGSRFEKTEAKLDD
jgi:hypothetical protein